jgi:hypothetical protein
MLHVTASFGFQRLFRGTFQPAGVTDVTLRR